MAERAQKQRRRRQVIAGAILAASLVVAAVTGVLWKQARGEALRAEAGKLLALGRTHLQDDPTAALAYARGSLDLFDTHEGGAPSPSRLCGAGPWPGSCPWTRSRGSFSSRRIRSGPTRITISPDGRWLAAKSEANRRVLLFPDDGENAPGPAPAARHDRPRGGVRSPFRPPHHRGAGPRVDALVPSRLARDPHRTAGDGRVLAVGRGAGREARGRHGDVAGERLPGADAPGRRPQGGRGTPSGRGPLGPGKAIPGGHRPSWPGARRSACTLSTGRIACGSWGGPGTLPWSLAYSPRGDLVASTDLSAETQISRRPRARRTPSASSRVPSTPGARARSSTRRAAASARWAPTAPRCSGTWRRCPTPSPS